MSRAYRISVRESIRRVVRGSDRVLTQLELLDVLPREKMGILITQELITRGFVKEEGHLVRRDGEVTVQIDPADGAVEVISEVIRDMELEAEKVGYADEDFGDDGRREAETRLREQLKRELENQADSQATTLDDAATDLLETALGDLQGELDTVINRVTALALKTKAAQLGEIKQISEDAETGNMTIVLEV